MNSSALGFVRYALRIGAIELVPEGRKLKNGRISPYFFNSGLFNTGRSIRELAEAYVRTLVKGLDLEDFPFCVQRSKLRVSLTYRWWLFFIFGAG